MDSNKVYKLSIYAFLMFCCGMIWQAEQAFLPQGLTLVLAPLAFWLLEQKGWKGLPTLASNILGIFAFAIAIAEVEGALPSFGGLGVKETPDYQFIGGLNLLIYFSWIILFMPKTPLYYWGMFVVGLLQVGISCIITNSSLYYVLLILFAFIAMWTLMLHMIFQARNQLLLISNVQEKSAQPQPAYAIAGSNGGVRLDESHLRASATINDLQPFSLQQESSVQDSIHFDSNETWINRRMVRGFLFAGTASILVASFLFAFIPRMWLGGGRSSFFDINSKKMQAGFSSTVNLGQFGELLDSNAPVMEVELIGLRGRAEDLNAYSESLGYETPLFRGAVLSKYKDGQWTASLSKSGSTPRSEIQYPTVQQKITLVNPSTQHLFGMSPVAYISLESNDENNVIRTPFTEEWKLEVQADSEVEYTVRSYLFTRPPDQPMGRVKGFTRNRRVSDQVDMLHNELLQIPETGFEKIKEVAQQLAAEVVDDELPFEFDGGIYKELNADSAVLKVVRRFERYLKSENQFIYSLDIAPQDSSIDPLVDFLLNTKSGHCEFYASSMVMLCRSVGIPARVITGFKGAEYNKLTKKYHIKQNDAHAWVEIVWGGVWYVFDPTPAAVEEAVQQGSGNRRTQIWDYLVSRWRSFVVNMSAERQSNIVYRPIIQKVMELKAILQEQGWGNFWRELWATVSNPENWFSYSGLFLISLFAGMLWLGRKFLRYLMSKLGMGNNEKRRKRSFQQLQLEFYKQYQKICRKEGLEREQTQTQLEFATEVESSWSPRLQPEQLKQLPQQLTEVYNRIRFGDQSPEAQELDRLREQLRNVEKELRK